MIEVKKNYLLVHLRKLNMRKRKMNFLLLHSDLVSLKIHKGVVQTM